MKDFIAALRKYGAIVGSSFMLAIMKAGDWCPSDLDIVLPDHTSKPFETFVLSHGYLKDFEIRDRHDNDYPSRNAPTRHSFRYVCYRNSTKKIDLCYIHFPNRPASHILTYHSTAVMNFFDGWAIYCLFPNWTFAGQFAKNKYQISPSLRTIAAINKLRARGFSEVAGSVQEWFPEAVSQVDGFIDRSKLRTIWRHELSA
ncbi:hypothetical protein DACRYDRAFT_107402 [Dacryopinax primogenitus]|uniref:Nucleotidyltransferase family protein n=1 Tax=Dacryopinax primogenitus (strain DJM 731) TaxID=1858805 RepID=M5G2P1_DACPD|nr:uncharacterized protein DACRYDRAFT_107402 [Dacryopinax primogenitus]EJU02485.1 hypothetical protein DACRYDRAFT_107402 [Dacryopinax primogenitus]